MKNVHVINHPLVQHKLSLMRNKEASTNSFRRLLNELSMLMAYEVTRDMPMHHVTIETPLETMSAPMIDGKKLVFVSILRAGNGILDGPWYAAGAAAGIRQAVRAYRGGELAVSLDLQVYVGAESPRDHVLVDGDPPVDAYDVYLRLHLLSHRLVRPNTASLDGATAGCGAWRMRASSLATPPCSTMRGSGCPCRPSCRWRSTATPRRWWRGSRR